MTRADYTDNQWDVQNSTGVAELFTTARRIHVVIGNTRHHYFTLQQAFGYLIKESIL
jgi:hypothetical protein